MKDLFRSVRWGSCRKGLRFFAPPPVDRLELLHVSSTWISADLDDWVAQRTREKWRCVTLQVHSAGEHTTSASFSATFMLEPWTAIKQFTFCEEPVAHCRDHTEAAWPAPTAPAPHSQQFHCQPPWTAASAGTHALSQAFPQSLTHRNLERYEMNVVVLSHRGLQWFLTRR